MAAELPRSANPELSVVISTLGSYELLTRVLDGYAAQEVDPRRFEVLVVVDRADPDRQAVELAIGARPYAVRMLTGTIPGLSANRNTGWRAAAAPVVLFTDNDTVPVKRLVGEHLRWHRNAPAPEVVVIGPVRWARELRVTPFMKWLEQGVQFDFGSIRGTEASWAHVYGANVSIKRSFLETVGGYDERRLPYGHEDLEWGYRAREHGLKVQFNRRAIVDHWRTMDIKFWKVRAERVAVTERRFCELHPDVEPHLYDKFSRAAALAPQRGRAAWLATYIPRGVPWLGPCVWNLADTYWSQQLAPEFLSAWEAEGSAARKRNQSVVSVAVERPASSAGSDPGGP
jgi:GT2 family glycosyltransferase